MDGRLIVFEGPDGVGKSTLAGLFKRHLENEGVEVVLESFPGKNPGSLGEVVYSIHHDVKGELLPNAKQALHIAAHIDAIERLILPKLRKGTTVVLDRFYWSTQVYGKVFGANPRLLDFLVSAEEVSWDGVSPDTLFLIDRPEAFRKEQTPEFFESLRQEYAKVGQSASFPVTKILNTTDTDTATRQIVDATRGYFQ